MCKTEKIFTIDDIVKDRCQENYNLVLCIDESDCSISIRDETLSVSYRYPRYIEGISKHEKYQHVCIHVSEFLSAYISDKPNSIITVNVYTPNMADHIKYPIIIDTRNNTIVIAHGMKCYRGNRVETIFNVDLTKKSPTSKCKTYVYNIFMLYLNALSSIVKYHELFIHINDTNNIVTNTFIKGNVIFSKVFRGTNELNGIGYIENLKLSSKDCIKTYIDFIGDIYKTSIPKEDDDINIINTKSVDNHESNDKQPVAEEMIYYITNVNKAPIKMYTILMLYFDVPDDYLGDFEMKQIKKSFTNHRDALEYLDRILIDDVIELNTNTDINQIFYFVKDGSIYSNTKELIREGIIVELEVNENDIK